MQATKECLIIDDDLDDQEIFVMCAKKISGHINCTTMNNGIEAISMLKAKIEYIPDYVFIDVNMPKLNGIDCLKIIKSIERLKYSKIFMYSTTSENSAVLKCRALGADDFIIKPSKTAELIDKLAEIFGSASEEVK